MLLAPVIPLALARADGGCTVIRRILVDRQPIFTAEDRARLPWLPLRAVDWLHVDTRARVIRHELVIHEGDCLDLARLEESERKLRATGFLAETDISAVTVAADTVDVLVRTREVWTTTLDFRYERFESRPIWSLAVDEHNLLGTGNSVSFGLSEDLDRRTGTLGLGLRQILDGQSRARILRGDTSDGSTTAWSLERPFFSLASDWGLGARYVHAGQRPRYYVDGRRYVRPHSDVTDLGVEVRRRVRTYSGGVWRVGLGLTVRSQGFNPEEGLELHDAVGSLGTATSIAAGLPEDRSFNSFDFALDHHTTRYGRERFLFEMGRVEDLPLGHEGELAVGWVTRLLGSSDTALAYRLRDVWIVTSRHLIMRSHLSVSGYYQVDRSLDVRSVGQAGGYWKVGDGFTLAAGALGAVGNNLDRHAPFLLGIDSGLRAARFQEFAGDRLVRGNLEARWVYRPGLADLVTPGIAAFFDVGTAWFENETDVTWHSFRGAVGFGARIGLSRAAVNEPIRVDLAWPVLYEGDRPAPVLSLGMGQVF
jgi:hypothetical protein